MRAAGALLIGLGAVFALIAAVWGRGGYYPSQAPILFLLAVGALICLGAGAAMLRYQKSGFTAGSHSLSTVAQRAFAAPAPVVQPEAAPEVAAAGSVVPPIIVPPIVVQPIARPDAIDEKTRDRALPTSDWVLLLPDGTTLPVADALVIGRQPVSSDGGPTAAVPSAQVSKSQARFRISDGQLGVRDLDSTNGTVIVRLDETEERVSSVAETMIQPGDRLEIGSYVLEVQRRS